MTKIQVWCAWERYSYEKQASLKIYSFDVSEKNFSNNNTAWVYAGTMEIEHDFVVPTSDELTGALVAGLRKEQADLIAKSNEIEGKIQQLLCIEHKNDKTAGDDFGTFQTTNGTVTREPGRTVHKLR